MIGRSKNTSQLRDMGCVKRNRPCSGGINNASRDELRCCMKFKRHTEVPIAICHDSPTPENTLQSDRNLAVGQRARPAKWVLTSQALAVLRALNDLDLAASVAGIDPGSCKFDGAPTEEDGLMPPSYRSCSLSGSSSPYCRARVASSAESKGGKSLSLRLTPRPCQDCCGDDVVRRCIAHSNYQTTRGMSSEGREFSGIQWFPLRPTAGPTFHQMPGRRAEAKING